MRVFSRFFDFGPARASSNYLTRAICARERAQTRISRHQWPTRVIITEIHLICERARATPAMADEPPRTPERPPRTPPGAPPPRAADPRELERMRTMRRLRRRPPGAHVPQRPGHTEGLVDAAGGSEPAEADGRNGHRPELARGRRAARDGSDSVGRGRSLAQTHRAPGAGVKDPRKKILPPEISSACMHPPDLSGKRVARGQS